jgi:hypothetical protein
VSAQLCYERPLSVPRRTATIPAQKKKGDSDIEAALDRNPPKRNLV